MAVDALAPLATLPRLEPLAPQSSTELAPAGGRGFASILNGLLDGNREATSAADTAVAALATGEAQDLHTVSLAVAQADLSFRLILELRNRLADAFQEVTRMQV